MTAFGEPRGCPKAARGEANRPRILSRYFGPIELLDDGHIEKWPLSGRSLHGDLLQTSRRRLMVFGAEFDTEIVAAEHLRRHQR